MKRRYLLLGALLLTGCGGSRAAESFDIRTIPLTYLRADEAAELVTPLGMGAAVSFRRDPPALILRGPTDQVDQIAEIIRRFDKPSPNVQLRFQIIEADGFTNSDPAIADVEAALQDVFRFRGYRLVGESLVQSEVPGNVTQQIVGRVGNQAGVPFMIHARLNRLLQGDSARAVSMDVELQGGTAQLGTSLTVPSGQTVVVGTAQSRQDGHTFILVVRPRIE